MKNSVTCFICLQSCDSHSFVYLDSIRKKFDKQQQQSTIGAKTKEKKKKHADSVNFRFFCVLQTHTQTFLRFVLIMNNSRPFNERIEEKNDADFFFFLPLFSIHKHKANSKVPLNHAQSRLQECFKARSFCFFILASIRRCERE